MLNADSSEGKEPTIYHYKYVPNESVTIRGKANNDQNQTFTVTITEPSDPEPEPAPEPPEDYLVDTYTIGPNTDAHGWRLTIDGLPKQGVDDEGNTVYYTYYIVEHRGNYSTAFANNGGIASGTITVTI